MRKLVAVLAACAIGVVALGICIVPQVSEDELWQSYADKPYWVYPTYDISKSPHAVSAAISSRSKSGDNVHLLLGSSELDLHDPCSSHPYHFFNEHNYEIDTISIGDGGFQSLYHAIDIGALDKLDSIPGRKVALIVSMQWFPWGGCKPEAFQNSFSWEAFELLMTNENISAETRAAVAKRAGELGIDGAKLQSAAGEGNPVSRVDYAINRIFTEKDRRNDLEKSLEKCIKSADVKDVRPAETPDWGQWAQREVKEAAADSSSNEWGIYDEYWWKYTEPWLEEYDASQYSSPYMDWETSELEDFKLFLKICNEIGVEPLIISPPVKGWYYDMCGYPSESRQAYHEMIRSVCEEYGARLVDYSDYDYDRYFLRDVMHLGGVGWVYVNQELMNYYSEGA